MCLLQWCVITRQFPGWSQTPGRSTPGPNRFPLVSSGANQVNCSQPCRFFVPPHCQLTQTPPDRGVQPMHSTAPQGAREVGLGRHAGFPRHLVESFFTNPAWSRGAAHTAVTWGAQEIGLCHHAGVIVPPLRRATSTNPA